MRLSKWSVMLFALAILGLGAGISQADGYGEFAGDEGQVAAANKGNLEGCNYVEGWRVGHWNCWWVGGEGVYFDDGFFTEWYNDGSVWYNTPQKFENGDIIQTILDVFITPEYREPIWIPGENE